MNDLQYPIDIDPYYSSPTGTSIPDFTGVTIDGAIATDSIQGAEEVVEGYDANDPTTLTLHDVYLDARATVSEYADISEQNTDLSFSGLGVTLTTPR